MHLKDIILQITWVELLSLVIFLFIANRSIIRGFNYEIVKLVQFIIAPCVAFATYGKLSEFAKAYLPQFLTYLKFFSFLAIFCGFYLLFNFIINLLEHVLAKDEIGFFEKFIAFIIGSVRSFFVISAVLITLCLYPLFEFKDTIYNISFGGKFLIETVPSTVAFVLKKTANENLAQELIENFRKETWPKNTNRKTLFEKNADSEGTYYKTLIERYRGYVNEATDIN